MQNSKKVALVGGLGKGSGLGEALVRRFRDEGYRVAAFVRSTPLDALPRDVIQMPLDLTDQEQVIGRINQLETETGPIAVYIHNAASLIRGPFTDCQPRDFEKAWRDGTLSAVTVCGAVTPHMLRRGRGALIFTGATASIRGGAGFAPFASAKFALRGLSQSLARELGPQGIHVAHVILDGLVNGQRACDQFGVSENRCMDPNHLAEVYLNLINQPTSCWTQELDLRPSIESF